MIDLFMSFALEIVIAILFVVIILQQRRLNKMDDQFLQSLKNSLRFYEATNDRMENYDHIIESLIGWMQRIESELKTKEDEEESDVELLQEVSKKIH